MVIFNSYVKLPEGIQPLLKWLRLGTPEEGHLKRVTRGFKERLRDSSKQYQQNLDLRRRAQAMFAVQFWQVLRLWFNQRWFLLNSWYWMILVCLSFHVPSLSEHLCGNKMSLERHGGHVEIGLTALSLVRKWSWQKTAPFILSSTTGGKKIGSSCLCYFLMAAYGGFMRLSHLDDWAPLPLGYLHVSSNFIHFLLVRVCKSQDMSKSTIQWAAAGNFPAATCCRGPRSLRKEPGAATQRPCQRGLGPTMRDGGPTMGWELTNGCVWPWFFIPLNMAMSQFH